MNKEYKELAVLSARLAESVLMDWDKEEQVRLAKEVATMCHSIFNDKESREFVELVKRMRDAQKNYYKDKKQVGYKVAYYNMINKETLVDEYLKKMEE